MESKSKSIVIKNLTSPNVEVRSYKNLSRSGGGGLGVLIKINKYIKKTLNKL